MNNVHYRTDSPTLPPAASSLIEARLAGVLDTEPDGIIVIDDKTRILLCNKGCERLLGYAASELVGREIALLLADDEESARGASRRAGRWPIVGTEREVHLRHRDGVAIPVEVAVGVSLTPEGRQHVCVLRDLRPRKQSEERLAELQAALMRMGRILAIEEMGTAVAHEINQPLTALMLYLQSVRVAARRPDPVDGLMVIAEKALAEAERACAIVRRIRKFAERRAPEQKLVDLRPLIDDAIELTLAGNRHRTRLVRSDDPNLPPTLVDPVLFQQVVVNLVRNALEAVSGRTAAEIRVSARRADDVIELSVEDNGPGIPAHAVDDLFSAFSSFTGNGLGLGLSISRTIAQSHGGDIRCDPGGDGRGATFVLRLPLRDDDATERTTLVPEGRGR